MYPITNSHRGGQDLGVPFVKVVFQILISPPPADPHNHRARVVEKRPLSPSTWGHPPHVEGMWPGTVQERGGPHSVPPSFLRPARLTCSDKGSGVDFWGNSTPFFKKNWGGVPLKIHTRPEGSGMDIWGEPHVIFFN